MTVPVSHVSETYDLAMGINSDVMGMQFGGADSKYPATLTVNWSNVKVKELVKEQYTVSVAANDDKTEKEEVIAVSALSDLKAGSYRLNSKLSCYVSAMGGVEFGEALLSGATMNVAEDGKTMVTLHFTTSTVTIYSVVANTYISSEQQYLSVSTHGRK